MDFYEYPTTRDMVNRGPRKSGEDSESFYKRNFGLAVAGLHSTSCAIQMVGEHLWEKNRRPYYKVYPTIAPMLLKLNLDVDTSLVHLPMPCFCIRFSKERPPLQFKWQDEDWHIRSMLVSPTTVQNRTEMFNGFVLWVDTGEVEEAPNGEFYSVHTYINLPIQRGMTLEQSLSALPYDVSAFRGMQMPEEIRTACARLACTLCLLENNPDIIEPDVLAKDRDKYEITKDPKYVERAKKRNKFGFNIGKDIEVIPHMRRPHPALMHTGHGRMIPRIVMRKGSVIHREAVVRVPTGFQGGQ
jgi:hypothetical protein